MLEVNMEYRKGVLFIRFVGELVKNKINGNEIENVDDVLSTGMTCVVFNLEELKMIDNSGLDYLWEKYQMVKSKGGVAFLCGIHHSTVKRRLKRSRLLTYMNEIQDELILLHQC